jgi:signal transduction histidine kinase
MIIKDTGHGIPEKDRPYLFDPFFTTKAGGTGLGLSIVYSIIQKHNGRIEVESELGKGSSFILSLPIRKEGAWREFSL